MQATTKTPFPTLLIILLGLLTAIGPLSIDMYLPAFRSIAADLDASVAQVTWSLSSFFLGICFGQLLYGPLLERFGRKRPLYAGLSLYFLASLGCALSPSVGLLIGFRFLQAVGGCVGMVTARAMVRDIFPVDQNARVFSLLMLVMSVSPIIAPTVGSFITVALGWRYVFAVLVAVVVLILPGIHWLLPETSPPNPQFSLRPGPILRSYRQVAVHPSFRKFALTGAVSYAGLYAYVGGAPFVFLKLYHVTEHQFGWIFAATAAGLIGASQVNSWLLRIAGSERIIAFATVTQLVIGLILVAVAFRGLPALWVTLVLVFAFLVCQGFIFPNATALALAPMARMAGTASGLIGAVQLGVGALASAAVGKLENETLVPMAGIMALCAAIATFIFHGSNKTRATS